MKFLLDINVFKEIGKDGPNANVAAWLKTVDDAELAISSLTVREIRKGIDRLRQRNADKADELDARTTDTFDAFDERILPVTRDVADLWGMMLAESERHIDDTGIAATARVHGLVVVTRNLKDFSGRGVATLDPFKPSPKINKP